MIGYIKYAVEMCSGVMIYIPRSIQIGSAIQKLIGGLHRQHGDSISQIFGGTDPTQSVGTIRESSVTETLASGSN
jgi:hypothetical protein